MRELPIGMQDFESIRENDEYLYVDKTEILLQLAKTKKITFSIFD